MTVKNRKQCRISRTREKILSDLQARANNSVTDRQGSINRDGY